MIKQAFGRACLSFISLLILGFGLTACGGGSDEGGDAVKSPDLPPSQLESMTMTCTPSSVAAGEIAQCAGSCVIRSVDEDGEITRTTGCPQFKCRSANEDIAIVESVDDASDTCVVRGVTEGQVDITGKTDGGQAKDVLQVLAAVISEFNIEPDNMNLPIGVSQQAQAFGKFSDGVTREVTSNTTWSSADAGIASVGNSTSNKGLVTGQSIGDTVITGAYSPDTNFMDTVNVTVRNARIVNDGLCVEPAPAGYAFNASDPCEPFDPVEDACEPGDTTINVNQSQQFVAYGVFDDNQRCDLTRDVTWTLDPAIDGATVGNDPDNGLVQAGDTTGNTNVVATYTEGGANEVASAPLTIAGGGRIAANSLSVGIPVEDTNGDGELNGADDLQKVFCVGAYDLVQGLQNSDDLPAAKQVYASHRLCEDGAASGECAEDDFGEVDSPVNETINQVTWTIGGDYFTGGQCVTSDTGPVGADNQPPASVGTSTDFMTPETDDPTVKGNTTATGELRLGTACVQGTLNIDGIPGSSTDGATAIVLPATSDEVLGQAVQLCNTLVPLFVLGGDEGAGATIQLVAALSDVLNPLLLALGEGGLDDVLNQVLTGISDNLTGEGAPLEPLISPLLGDVVEGIVDTNVFSPVNCALGTLLQGLLGGDPSEIEALAECQPDPTATSAPSEESGS